MTDYQPYLEYPDYGMNPWSDDVTQGRSAVGAAQSAAMNIDGQNLMNQQNMASQYASQTQAPQQPAANNYPTMPNDYGLGTQAKAEPNATSRGFNPWSLQGEALSR